VEEGILHVELLNGSVTGDNSAEHRANGGRFHNRAESLVVVDFRALSETPNDPSAWSLCVKTHLPVTTLEP
jgi:hypothetical protein